MLIKAIVTEIFLLLAFFLLVLSSKKTKKSFIIFVILLSIGEIPLLYAIVDQQINAYPDANIGLGLIFMYTWLISSIVFVVGVVKLLRKK